MAFHVPDQFRVRRGRCPREWAKYATEPSIGNFGLFFVRLQKSGPIFKVIAAEGDGWEHVSVSLPDRCPLWKEMCAIKDLFWDENDAVIQIHPRKSEYVNIDKHCLHLWRPTAVEVPLPPIYMV